MFFESAAYLYEAHGIFVSHSTELLQNGGLPLLAEFQSRLTTNLPCVLDNTGGDFCKRASEYGMIDGNAAVRSQTRFFAAASAVSSALADVDAPGSSLIGGISGHPCGKGVVR
jgi:hypothetical protein